MTAKETIGKLDGQTLYQYLTKPAGWLKVLLQMLVGIAAIIITVVSLVSDMRHGRPAGSVAKHAIAIIAASLAVAASIELAYTLFTDGLHPNQGATTDHDQTR
jgi:L-cystine uptake protein TcyP (sodium:dicarboxylate symporter family)